MPQISKSRSYFIRADKEDENGMKSAPATFAFLLHFLLVVQAQAKQDGLMEVVEKQHKGENLMPQNRRENKKRFSS